MQSDYQVSVLVPSRVDMYNNTTQSESDDDIKVNCYIFWCNRVVVNLLQLAGPLQMLFAFLFTCYQSYRHRPIRSWGIKAFFLRLWICCQTSELFIAFGRISRACGMFAVTSLSFIFLDCLLNPLYFWIFRPCWRGILSAFPGRGVKRSPEGDSAWYCGILLLLCYWRETFKLLGSWLVLR